MYHNNVGSVIILKSADEIDSESVATGVAATERDIARIGGFPNIFSNNANIRSDEHPIIDNNNYTPSLKESADLMQQNNIRRLPVLDGKGKLVGIVTAKDLLRSTMDIIKKVMVEQDFMTLAF